MQLVLSNNRILAHGENFLYMGGGVVINTETGAKYGNATVTECDGCPSDIDAVGYEYHAGRFIPCAPFGTGTGNVAVYCDECKTPRDSGMSIDVVCGMSLFPIFVAYKDRESLDAAFGKNNEDIVRGVGAGLAMWGWFKGIDKTAHPFTHLCKMSTLNDMNLDVYNEIISDDKFYLYSAIDSSDYATDKVFHEYEVSMNTRDAEDDIDATIQITLTETDLLAPFVMDCSFSGDANVNSGTIYFNDVEVDSYSYSQSGKSKSFRETKNWSDYNISEPGTYNVRMILSKGINYNETTGFFLIRCAKEY